MVTVRASLCSMAESTSSCGVGSSTSDLTTDESYSTFGHNYYYLHHFIRIIYELILLFHTVFAYLCNDY